MCAFSVQEKIKMLKGAGFTSEDLLSTQGSADDLYNKIKGLLAEYSVPANQCAERTEKLKLIAKIVFGEPIDEPASS